MLKHMHQQNTSIHPYQEVDNGRAALAASQKEFISPSPQEAALYAQFNLDIEKTLHINMNALSAANPALAALIRPHIGLETYRLRLIISNNSLEDIEVAYADGQTLRLNDKQQQDEAIQNISSIASDKVYFLFGIHLGIHLFILFDATNATFNPTLPHLNIQVPIYVAEPDINRFLFLLRMTDLTDIILSKRVLFFIGENIIENIHAFFSQPGVRCPNEYITTSESPISHTIPDLIQASNHKMLTDATSYWNNAKEYYQSRTQDEWKSLFSGQSNRPLRVMAYTSRYSSYLQYATRDLLCGFENIGCETSYLIEEDNTRIEMNPYSIAYEIHRFSPDIIFTLDHLRSCQGNVVPEQIPFVAWIQDILPNVFKNNPNRGLHERDFVFSFSRKWITNGEFNVPSFEGKNIHFLPLGINCAVYHTIANLKKGIDVLFVSHVYKQNLTIQHIKNPSDVFEPLANERILLENGTLSLDQLIDVYKKISNTISQLDYLDICELLHNEDRCTNLFTPLLLQHGISPAPDIVSTLCSRESRFMMEVINLAKAIPLSYLIANNINLQVYGSHWEQFDALRPVSMGSASNGVFLNELMNRSRICISNSGGTSLHMRAIEILASGSFLLVRRLPNEWDNSNIQDYFQDGIDMVLFDDEKDLLAKIQYFLTHETEREEIAKHGQETAIRFFSYDQLAKQIITTVASAL